eukprot:834362_1
MTRIARTLILLILISGTPIIHCAQDPNDLHGNYKNNPSSPSSPKHHGARFGYHENQGSSTNLQGAQGLYTENDTDTVSSSSNYETPEPVALLEKKHKFKHAEPFVGKAKHLDPTVFQSMKKLFGPTQVPTDKQLTISETNIARPFHSPIRASHATPEITENIRNSPSQSDKSQSSTSSYVSQSVSELDLSEDNHALNTGDSDKSLSSMPEAAEAYDCAQSNDSHLCNISINVGTKLTGPPYNTDEVEGSGDHSLTTAEIEASMYEEHEEKAALLQSSTVKAHNNDAYNPVNQGNTYSDDDAQNNDGYNPVNQGNTFSDDDADGEQDDIDTDSKMSDVDADRNYARIQREKHNLKYRLYLAEQEAYAAQQTISQLKKQIKVTRIPKLAEIHYFKNGEEEVDGSGAWTLANVNLAILSDKYPRLRSGSFKVPPGDYLISLHASPSAQPINGLGISMSCSDTCLTGKRKCSYPDIKGSNLESNAGRILCQVEESFKHTVDLKLRVDVDDPQAAIRLNNDMYCKIFVTRK